MMLDIGREERIKEFGRKYQKKGNIFIPDCMIGIDLFSIDNEKIYSDVFRGNSWTRNFYNFVFSCMCKGNGGNSNNFGAGYMSAKSTAAAVRYDPTYCGGRVNQAILASGWTNNVANNSFGIVVGSSDTAFDKDQYAMQAVIAAGTAAGQLSYAVMAAPTIGYASKIWTVYNYRTFTNGSGGSVTVKEIGIYSYIDLFTNGQNMMIERTVLSPSIAVANGQKLQVSYALSMDFSAID